MTKRVAIIASNGGLETAYKVLNIATAAAATDAEVGIFFTFDGLTIIHKDASTLLTMGAGKEHYMEGFKKANVPSIQELLEIAKESGVKLIACQMTMDVTGLQKEHFIDGIEVGGAATFLDFAYDADVSVTF
ncbi:DsrE/DsrF/DrsH-like family protein [Alicyclobacillus dauci]|uniref:DsrE/DsrF/DrsH-like family protein n=1 Tax=Alicyclobacillus dauci TaxID=1475485 RepID=A0ABY6Z2M3_9BACL|nr:DsrE/DsrF/DrsH-like family protein [Alicyclobacillus dauci]WAH36446.1 DsrE/DsrF/DrsH-like family protein [Alicyclobacillus dauci]